MKDKKYKVKEHLDGSTTYSPSSGVGFFNPFVLVKKNFVLEYKEVNENIKSSIFFMLMLQTIGSDNRLNSAQLNQIGDQLGIAKMTVSRFVKSFNECGILIRVVKGIYKMNEELTIFKQDHEGYLALKEETKSLTQNVTNNYNIVVQDGQSLKDILLAKHDENVKALNNI